EDRPFVGVDVEELDDVRVLQGRRDPRLVQDLTREVSVLRDLAPDALDDEELLEPAEPLGARKQDLGHPAGRQRGEDLVALEEGRALSARGVEIHVRHGTSRRAYHPSWHYCGRSWRMEWA